MWETVGMKKKPVHPKEPGIGGNKKPKVAAISARVLRASQPPAATGSSEK
jgi:hypothetical protein